MVSALVTPEGIVHRLYVGESSDYLKVITGLRQGCVASPTLFNAYMDAYKEFGINISTKETEWMKVQRVEDPPPIN